jgi:hypothetical protein
MIELGDVEYGLSCLIYMGVFFFPLYACFQIPGCAFYKIRQNWLPLCFIIWPADMFVGTSMVSIACLLRAFLQMIEKYRP